MNEKIALSSLDTVVLYELEQIDNDAKSHNINRNTFLVESALKQVEI